MPRERQVSCQWAGCIAALANDANADDADLSETAGSFREGGEIRAPQPKEYLGVVDGEGGRARVRSSTRKGADPVRYA